jgi:uncharacterized protein YejL (UPF0352 family)
VPFRRFFAERGAKHPTAYSMALLALGGVVSMMIAVTISVQASNRAIAQNRAQEQKAQLEARRAACQVIVTQADVFDPARGGSLPSTTAGRKAAGAWRSLAQQFQCEER